MEACLWSVQISRSKLSLSRRESLQVWPFLRRFITYVLICLSGCCLSTYGSLWWLCRWHCVTASSLTDQTQLSNRPNLCSYVIISLFSTWYYHILLIIQLYWHDKHWWWSKPDYLLVFKEKNLCISFWFRIMHCCISIPTTDNNTSTSMIWVTLKTWAGVPWTIREFDIVWRVVTLWVAIDCINHECRHDAAQVGFVAPQLFLPAQPYAAVEALFLCLVCWSFCLFRLLFVSSKIYFVRFTSILNRFWWNLQ